MQPRTHTNTHTNALLGTFLHAATRKPHTHTNALPDTKRDKHPGFLHRLYTGFCTARQPAPALPFFWLYLFIYKTCIFL